MALSSNLISQFVKSTKDYDKNSVESTFYGTTVIYDKKTYVRLDGSDLLTPVNTTADALDGERVTVLIKNHSATITGNVSSPAARTDRVEEIGTVASTNKLNIDAASGRITAVEGNFEILNSDYGNFKELTAGRFSAVDGKFEKLSSVYATIDNLEAATGRISNLETTALTAESATIKTLQSDIASIDTLIFGSASGEVIQTSFANAVIAQLGNAQIKSAMIDSVSASKITSGAILTNNVQVKSEDGSLVIADQTIQISDDNKTVRVQIGEDASGDYSIYIWDADGKLMFSPKGVEEDGITQAIIKDNMVKDNANISASKLNIDSLFTVINEDNSHTIYGTKVIVDEKGQTLDVAFTQMTTEVGTLSETISSQGTSISAIQGQIESKIWKQDIETITDPLGGKVDTLSTQYSSLNQTVSGLSLTVASHTTQIQAKADGSAVTEVNNKVTALTQDLSGFKTTVSETYATQSSLSSYVTSFESQINQTKNDITLSVSETYATKSALSATDTKASNAATAAQNAQNAADAAQDDIDDLENSVSTTYATKSELSIEKNAILSTVSETYSTKDELSTVESKIAQTKDEINLSVSNTYATKSSLSATDTKASNAATAAQNAQNTADDAQDNVNSLRQAVTSTYATKSELSVEKDAILSTVSETYTTKEEFENLEVGGRNLIVRSQSTENAYYNTSGTLQTGVTNGTAAMTEYIPIEPGGQYTFSRAAGTGDFFRFNYYDANKTYLGRKAITEIKTNAAGTYIWTAPSTAYYLLVSYPWSEESKAKLEKGNKATDWTPAPEDMATSEELSTVESKITQTAESIESEVASTYQTKSAMSSYPTTTQMNSAIEQKASSITSTVSSTYATKSDLNTTNANVTAAQNAANAAQNDIDNLEIGGRNLWINASPYRADTPFVWIRSGTDNNTANFDGNRIYCPTPFKAGDIITVQAKSNLPWAKIHGGSASNNGKVGFWLYLGTLEQVSSGTYTSPKYLAGDGTSTEFVATYTLPTVSGVDDIYIGFRINSYSYNSVELEAHYWDIKMERGNKATDWTPAPEDTETEVARLETVITQTSSDLTVQINNVSTAASNAQTTANTAVTNAATAQTTANNAATAASNAQTTADAAKKKLYHSASGTAGTAGYIGLCTIVVSSTYMNRPILFTLNNRGQQSSNVSFALANANNTDPGLSHLQYDGEIKVWAYKSTTSTWILIAQKSESYDTIYVTDFANNNSGVKVTWTNTHYSSLPTSNITAGTLLAGKITKSTVDNAAKTATNYLNFSSSGLVVGDMTASTLGKNVLIDSDSVDIRNGTDVLASFGANAISLGNNSQDTVINLVNNTASMRVEVADDDLMINQFILETDQYMQLSAQGIFLNTYYDASNYSVSTSIHSLDGAITISTSSTNSSGTSSNYIELNPNGITLHDGTDYLWLSDGKLMHNYIYNVDGQAYLGTTAIRGTLEVNSSSTFKSAISSTGNMTITNTNPYIKFIDTGTSSATSYIQGYQGKVGMGFGWVNSLTVDQVGNVVIPGSITPGGIVLPHGDRFYGIDAGTTTQEIIRFGGDATTPILIIGDSLYTNGAGRLNLCSASAIHMITTTERIILESTTASPYSAYFRPYNDGKCTLGTSSKRFYAVYATNASIQTSDVREKENIVPLGTSSIVSRDDVEPIDIHSELFDRLKPVQYNFIKGNGRTCYGLIAQDVLESMTELGIGWDELDLVHHEFWPDEDTGENKETFGLAYTNLIALLIYEVQKLKAEVAALKNS